MLNAKSDLKDTCNHKQYNPTYKNAYILKDVFVKHSFHPLAMAD